MMNGGRLLVRTETDEDQVVINIVDTGIGMDEKDLKRIYEPFFTKESIKRHRAWTCDNVHHHPGA